MYYSYRLLAEQLTEAGLAVVRFDYDGTGDSVGDDDDPGRVEAWLGSIQAALDVLTVSGVRRVGLLGMRIGALFAAEEAARTGKPDALVLWDPCVTGGSFLREQRALMTLSIGGDERGEGVVDSPGLRFDTETVRSLAEIELRAVGARTLVLTHPGRPRPRGLVRRLEGAGVDWMEATGQTELLDSNLQRPPFEAIERVADWLSCALAGPSFPVKAPESAAAVVGRSCSGEPIVERPVALGPVPLFGIVTEVPDEAAGPTIVFINEGNTPHIGQSRMWVDLARAWAAVGLRVLRFDLSGNGDSGVRPGQAPHGAMALEAFDDLYEVRRAISPGDPGNVVLIGLCSGAYQAIEEGLIAPPRGVCLINPIMTFALKDDTGTSTAQRRARQATKAWVCRTAKVPVTWIARRWGKDDPDRWIEAFEIGRWPAATARRRRVPPAIWSLVNRFLLDNQTVSSLERLVKARVDTILLCGPEDLQPIALGAQGQLRRLERSELFRLVVLPELDHAGLLVEQRRLLKKTLTDHVVGRYAPMAQADTARTALTGQRVHAPAAPRRSALR